MNIHHFSLVLLQYSIFQVGSHLFPSALSRQSRCRTPTQGSPLSHPPLFPPYPRFVSEFTQRRTSCLPGHGATSVHGCESCAECRLQCILLCTVHHASNPEALHWHCASQSIKPRFSFSSEARMRGDRCMSNCRWCREEFIARKPPFVRTK